MSQATLIEGNKEFIVTMAIHLSEKEDGSPVEEGFLVIDVVVRRVIAKSNDEAITKFIDNTNDVIQHHLVVTFTTPEAYELNQITTIE